MTIMPRRTTLLSIEKLEELREQCCELIIDCNGDDSAEDRIEQIHDTIDEELAKLELSIYPLADAKLPLRIRKWQRELDRISMR